MNRRIRQALLVLAVIIFAVVTPLIVLYALGFRLTREQVGVLALESAPSRAEVYLDNQRVGTTPQTISGVGGSAALISLRKPGYLPWEKRLSFTTGVTSAVRSVLIPEHIQPEALAENINQFALAPNRNLVAALDTGSKLTIYDETGQIVIPAKSLPRKPISLLWSPDSTFIVLSYSAGQHDVLSLADSILHKLPAFTLLNHDSLSWDPRVPGRFLGLLSDGSLRAYTVGEETSELLAQNLTAFAPGAEKVFALAPQALSQMNLQGVKNETADLPLPKLAKKIFLGTGDNLAIWFQDGSVSLLEEKTFKEIATGVSALEFSPNGALLYLQTAPQELMAYNVSDERLMQIPLGRPYLVTRVSQPITHPQWFAGSQHLVYQLGDQIILIEIDTRDHPISHVIDSTNMTDAEVAVGEDGTSLFYLKHSPLRAVSLVKTNLEIE